jgi:hypothetical protein
MKKIHLMIAAAIVSIGFTACKDKTSETTTTSRVEVLNAYVDSVENLTPVYTTEYWTTIDNGYRERMLAEKDFADLSAEERTRAEAAKARYEALRSTYEVKIREGAGTMTTPAYKVTVRNMLFGEGKVSDDLSFSYVNGQNIRSVYEGFVDNVTHNKDRFTKEDWDEVAALYGALDARKEAIEKDIDTKDNLVIAKLKVKYTAVYATNKYGQGDGTTH